MFVQVHKNLKNTKSHCFHQHSLSHRPNSGPKTNVTQLSANISAALRQKKKITKNQTIAWLFYWSGSRVVGQGAEEKYIAKNEGSFAKLRSVASLTK